MLRMLGHQPPANSPMDYYLAGEPVISYSPSSNTDSMSREP
jgi:hypothetical protein